MPLPVEDQLADLFTTDAVFNSGDGDGDDDPGRLR